MWKNCVLFCVLWEKSPVTVSYTWVTFLNYLLVVHYVLPVSLYKVRLVVLFSWNKKAKLVTLLASIKGVVLYYHSSPESLSGVLATYFLLRYSSNEKAHIADSWTFCTHHDLAPAALFLPCGTKNWTLKLGKKFSGDHKYLTSIFTFCSKGECTLLFPQSVSNSRRVRIYSSILFLAYGQLQEQRVAARWWWWLRAAVKKTLLSHITINEWPACTWAHSYLCMNVISLWMEAAVVAVNTWGV